MDAVDAMGNQNLQNDQVSQFLDRDFDVLCVNMVDRTAAGSIVDKAMQADVPVVFFNREPVEEDMCRWDKLYYVCSKADESGVLEGGIVVDAYQAQPERWDKKGDGKLQYVLLEGEQGHQDSLIRTEVTIKTITDAGIELDKLAGETADWQRPRRGCSWSSGSRSSGTRLSWSSAITTIWPWALWIPTRPWALRSCP